MVAFDPEACLSVPGRLVLGPTTSFSTTAYPFGGTELGFASDCVVVKEAEFAYALSEGRGAARAKTYRGATWAGLVFTMTQFNPTAYNKIWASVTTSQGGFGGANTLSLPQLGRNVQPGLVAPSAPVVHVPDHPEHPATIIYAPAWVEEARQKLAMQLQKPLESVLVLVCGLDATARDIMIGRIEDLSPT